MGRRSPVAWAGIVWQVHFNYYTCIAPAGATSEDTTLPVMLKYTNEETVVLSVFNGVICSFMVPILISFCLNMV